MEQILIKKARYCAIGRKPSWYCFFFRINKINGKTNPKRGQTVHWIGAQCVCVLLDLRDKLLNMLQNVSGF